MKLNWGTYIAISFVAFAAFILYMVIKTFGYTIELETPDYYSQELKYQNVIDKQNNLKEGDQLKFQNGNNEVNIIYPKSQKSISGKIKFMRPSDSRLDFTVDVRVDDSANIQHIDNAKLAVGLYKIQADWIADGNEYYMSENFYVQK